MNRLSRRQFLKAAAATTTTLAFSARSWSQIAGANSDIRVAVIGLNGRGGDSHVPGLLRIKGVRLVALCDPDTAVLDKVKAKVAPDVKTYTDVRQLLASSDVDAVTIATPNHWHSLGGIWACQAGKDVFVEKPVSHNVWEGRQFVAAAQKYQRVVQAGTQIRSGDGLTEAVAWIRAGNLGKITAARGFCYKRRASIGKTTGPQTVSSTVDYSLWCGPAPNAPLRRRRLHYDWHWDFVTGNGDVGNQGIHQMDVARWFLGEPGLPRHTLSVGGRLGYVDDGNTPNTQIVVHDYATAPLIFEVRGLPSKTEQTADPNAAGPTGADAAEAAANTMDRYRGVRVGNVIDCEGGYLVTSSYFSAQAFDRDGKLVKEFRGSDRHMANFIDVVRSRKTADLRGPIGEGHVSSALCHLGNISHQLGRAVPPEEIREKIKGDALQSEAFGRLTEHLAANGVDLAKDKLTLGAWLTMDPATEKITAAQGTELAKANAMLTREYRAPFVVPEKV
jgi:predicted dehydrogenase